MDGWMYERRRTGGWVDVGTEMYVRGSELMRQYIPLRQKRQKAASSTKKADPPSVFVGEKLVFVTCYRLTHSSSWNLPFLPCLVVLALLIRRTASSLTLTPYTYKLLPVHLSPCPHPVFQPPCAATHVKVGFLGNVGKVNTRLSC